MNAVPGDPTPFREYARLLLDAGLTRTADTVLTFAMQRLGGGRQVAAELAELKGALGMWEASASNWRQAMSYAPYLEASAIFVLGAANGVARDTIREILVADPKDLSVRRILAGLEMRWSSAREAWNALRVLTPTDSVVDGLAAVRRRRRGTRIVARGPRCVRGGAWPATQGEPGRARGDGGAAGRGAGVRAGLGGFAGVLARHLRRPARWRWCACAR